MSTDGRPDLVVTSDESHRVTILLGQGDGRFTPIAGGALTVAERPSEIALGDVNGDANLNLTLASHDSYTWFVAIGDVNGDRKLDLVTTHNEDRLLSVLLGDGRGSFTEVEGSPFDIGEKAWQIRLVDLNRDGNADAVAAADSGVRVLLGDGRGAFTQAPGSPFATGKGTWSLAVADVNSDGRSDVATSNLESGSVTVLLGQ
jgi:hypothetical protein